jgi:hypothetical protein
LTGAFAAAAAFAAVVFAGAFAAAAFLTGAFAGAFAAAVVGAESALTCSDSALSTSSAVFVLVAIRTPFRVFGQY